MRAAFPVLVTVVVGAPVLAAETGVRLDAPLSLSDTVRLGVTQNLELMAERTALAREQAKKRSAWRSYSPVLTMRTGAFRERPLGLLPASSLFSYSAGISWLSPVGTVVSADLAMGHVVSGAPAAEVNQGTVSVGVSQPLLKDAWLAGAALPLEEAELSFALQRELFRSALNSVIFELESAYWDLAVAEADVAIKTRSRDRAQEQFEDTQENIRRGILAPIEIYVVQENVVFFEQELLQAQENLGIARRRLARLLAVEPAAELRPADPLEKPTFTLAPSDAILATGLAANPRIQSQRLRRELAATQERYAVNQSLPALDVGASISMAGAGASYGGAWRDTFADRTPQAQVGVLFALPLDRGAINASVEAATLERKRQEVALQSEELRIRQEILDGVSELSANLAMLGLTERQVELAELKLQAETDKYKNGISTLADVVRFQRELDNASIRLRRVIRSVHVGRSRLLVAQGTLHEAFGIEVR